MSDYARKNPAEYTLRTPKAVEDTVVKAYKGIENGVVSAYKKIKDKFVDTFLERVEQEDADGPEIPGELAGQ